MQKNLKKCGSVVTFTSCSNIRPKESWAQKKTDVKGDKEKNENTNIFFRLNFELLENSKMLIFQLSWTRKNKFEIEISVFLSIWITNSISFFDSVEFTERHICIHKFYERVFKSWMNKKKSFRVLKDNKKQENLQVLNILVFIFYLFLKK